MEPENTWSVDVEPENETVEEPEEDFEIVEPEASVEVVDHVDVSEKPVPPPKPDNISVVPRVVAVTASE